MELIVLILIILLLFGGGGFYAGRGPAGGAGWSANPLSIILFVLMICLIIAVLNHTAIGF